MEGNDISYYLEEITAIKRGNFGGQFVNAKPLYLLSIISAIEEKVLLANKILYPLVELEDIYYSISMTYEPFRKASEFSLPFFHMSIDPFYHIKWKEVPFLPSPHRHSPSKKFLRENVIFAYLDEPLWSLLQDFLMREKIKQTIIDFYF